MDFVGYKKKRPSPADTEKGLKTLLLYSKSIQKHPHGRGEETHCSFFFCV